MAKKTVGNDPLAIANEMAQLDSKNYDFYDALTDEEKKKISLYLFIRWGASIYGSIDFQSYYLMSINQNLNVNFFNINKHPKLQWLCSAASSPGLGNQKHYWLTGTKKSKGSKLKTQLLELMPDSKESDIDLILKVNSESEILNWLRATGMTEKELEQLTK